MKSVIVKDIKPNQSLISVGKQLFLANKSSEEFKGGFQDLQIVKKHQFDNKIRFDISQKHNSLFLFDDNAKFLKTYQLSEFIASLDLPQLQAQSRLKKKLTDIAVVDVETREKQLEGVLVSDKVGEVKFIGIERMIQEGVQADLTQQQIQESEERDESAKTLFGQQQETIAIGITDDNKTLIAIDTLNRIRVSDFPNVFNIRHMILLHKNLTTYPYTSRITDFTFLGSDKIATYSAIDNHLLITDLISGSTLYNSKKLLTEQKLIIEGLTSSKTGRLCLLTSDAKANAHSVLALSEDFSDIATIIPAEALKNETKQKVAFSDQRLIKISAEDEQFEQVKGIQMFDL